MATRPVMFVLALAFIHGASLNAAAGSDLWDDRALRIVQTTEPSFPPTVAAEGINEGRVRAVLNVDADGTLIDYLVTAYTRREFANELASHVRNWKFEPARQRGEPVASRVEVVFAFQSRGMVVSLTPQGSVGVTTNRLVRPTWTSLVCTAAELDEPVSAVHVVQPQHPGSRVSPTPDRPTVTIDFYIDMEGRPRMPVVLRAAHELYAMAALDALMLWEFKPPTRQGQPMIVRATQQFAFAAGKP